MPNDSLPTPLDGQSPPSRGVDPDLARRREILAAGPTGDALTRRGGPEPRVPARAIRDLILAKCAAAGVDVNDLFPTRLEHSAGTYWDRLNDRVDRHGDDTTVPVRHVYAMLSACKWASTQLGIEPVFTAADVAEVAPDGAWAGQMTLTATPNFDVLAAEAGFEVTVARPHSVSIALAVARLMGAPDDVSDVFEGGPEGLDASVLAHADAIVQLFKDAPTLSRAQVETALHALYGDVEWHVGAAGTGKSGAMKAYERLLDERLRDSAASSDTPADTDGESL